MATQFKLSTNQLASLLRHWASQAAPLHSQLSDALGELIDLGEIPPATRLPSERALAEALAVSRTTVVSAYSALRSQGLLASRQGSGTWVPEPATRRNQQGIVLAGLRAGEEDLLRTFVDSSVATIDLSSAAIPGLPLVTEVATSLDRSDYSSLVGGHGYAPKGLEVLRAGIAQLLTGEGETTTPEEILVTSGAQQALELVSLSYIDRGDKIVVEDPTFRGALQLFRSRGADIRTVASDIHGASITDLEREIRRGDARLLYLQPNGNNPSGAVMPTEARRYLGRLLDETDAVLVDDSALGDIALNDHRPPSLGTFSESDRTLRIGSLSKIFWGGLRVGWIRAAPAVVNRLARAKASSDLGTSLPSQLIASAMLPHIEACRTIRREELSQSLERATDLLSDLLPSWQWNSPQAGSSLWIEIPSTDASSYTQIALRHGVEILPGTKFSATRNFDDHIRLPFHLKATMQTAAVARLSRAWEDFRELHPRPPSIDVL